MGPNAWTEIIEIEIPLRVITLPIHYRSVSGWSSVMVKELLEAKAQFIVMLEGN